MDKYYHFTSYKNLGDINDKGLVPNLGSRCQSIDDNRKAVFLSKGDNYAIISYALTLAYYNKIISGEGLEIISDIQEDIDRRIASGRRMDMFSIPILQERINRINKVIHCGNFFDYLDGEGCFLSVNELNGVNSNNPADCFYNDIIPSNKINVLNLKYKPTGEITSYREAILSYFMSIHSLDDICSLVSDKSVIDDITNLYLNTSIYYDTNYYELYEIPLNEYCEEPKIKTLINH